MKKIVASILSMSLILVFVMSTVSVQAATVSEGKKIQYLGSTYTLPAKAKKIVITGALEAMEDALVLGVKPVGAMTVGGTFPTLFNPITKSSKAIGEKAQPSLEDILKLQPDVILSSTKFPAETNEKLKLIATTIPVSHIATNWEANLRMLGQLTGTQAKAEILLKKYKTDLAKAKENFNKNNLKGKKVVVIRIRAGNITIYPTDVYFNPIPYKELGLTPPAEVVAAKAQEIISLEKFSEINPDYIFLQFAESENPSHPKALEDLQKQPIWKALNAVKNNKVFVNIVDPMAQGGTAWSKINFLKALLPKLK